MSELPRSPETQRKCTNACVYDHNSQVISELWKKKIYRQKLNTAYKKSYGKYLKLIKLSVNEYKIKTWVGLGVVKLAESKRWLPGREIQWILTILLVTPLSPLLRSEQIMSNVTNIRINYYTAQFSSRSQFTNRVIKILRICNVSPFVVCWDNLGIHWRKQHSWLLSDHFIKSFWIWIQLNCEEICQTIQTIVNSEYIYGSPIWPHINRHFRQDLFFDLKQIH